MIRKPVSHYYTGCDGTKLATDLYLPDVVPGEKLSTIIYTGLGGRKELYEEQKSMITALVDNKYAVLVIELRGNGASFGSHEGFLNLLDGQDVKAIMETIAQQEWSDGQFATFGGSVKGFVQDLIAGAQPKGLKAVIPCDCNIDFYYQDFPNGASRHLVSGSEGAQGVLGVPVDEDIDGSMAQAAWEEHRANLGFLQQYVPNMRRDSVNPRIGYAPAMVIPTWERLEEEKASGAFYYKNGSWFDPGATAAMLCYQIFGGKLLIGPWRHCEMYHCNKELPETGNMPVFDMPNGSFQWEQDYLQFYEAVLRQKGTYLQQPPIRYYTVGETPGEEWKYADVLPFSNTKREKFFLTTEKSGSIHSCLDGSLKGTCPKECETAEYTVNKDITLFGPGMTLDRNLGSSFAKEAEKCLTFTSGALDADRELTGNPLLDLWVTSTHKDGIFLAVLEEVLPDGSTYFLADGAIRASHAKTTPNPYYNSLEIPYHAGMSDDLVQMDEKVPLQLSFHLEAVSKIIHKGSMLRLSIFCGERFYQQPEEVGEDTPEIRLWMGEGTESFLSLPWITPEITHFAGEIQIGEEKQKADVYLLTQGIYVHCQGEWSHYPCKVEREENGDVIYHAENLTIEKTRKEDKEIAVATGQLSFCLKASLPDMRK